MRKNYSIGEAQNHLAELIADLATDDVMQITQHGRPVAFLLSSRKDQRLQQRQIGFWDAYLPFRQQLERDGVDLNPAEVFAAVRVQKEGRE